MVYPAATSRCFAVSTAWYGDGELSTNCRNLLAAAMVLVLEGRGMEGWRERERERLKLLLSRNYRNTLMEQREWETF
jgi:hypothetical protein